MTAKNGKTMSKKVKICPFRLPDELKPFFNERLTGPYVVSTPNSLLQCALHISSMFSFVLNITIIIL